MTYLESARSVMITRDRAVFELKQHDASSDDIDLFFEQLGYVEMYRADAVLEFLGY